MYRICIYDFIFLSFPQQLKKMYCFIVLPFCSNGYMICMEEHAWPNSRSSNNGYMYRITCMTLFPSPFSNNWRKFIGLLSFISAVMGIFTGENAWLYFPSLFQQWVYYRRKCKTIFLPFPNIGLMCRRTWLYFPKSRPIFLSIMKKKVTRYFCLYWKKSHPIFLFVLEKKVTPQ